MIQLFLNKSSARKKIGRLHKIEMSRVEKGRSLVIVKTLPALVIFQHGSFSMVFKDYVQICSCVFVKMRFVWTTRDPFSFRLFNQARS